MTKKQFLHELKSFFKKQKKEDLNNTLNYYNVLIDDYIKGGATEEEAVACLDTPQEIFNKFNFDYAKENTHQNEKNTKKIAESVFAIPFISLAVAICFVAIVVCILILICLFSVEVILALGGIGGVIGSFLYIAEHIPTALVLLGASLIALGIVVLTVKPFLRFCAILIAMSIKGFKRTYVLVLGKQKEKYE